MSRYIDAEICRRRISDERTDDKRWNEALNRACRIVCEQPTADVVPVSVVEHIKWERDCFAEQIREIGGEPFMKWECTDVVSVVRCKACKYYYQNNDVTFCNKHKNETKPEHYCSAGRRRDDERGKNQKDDG